MTSPSGLHDPQDRGMVAPDGPEASGQLAAYREVTALLEASRCSAPEDFAARVLARLPPEPIRAARRAWWDCASFAPARWLVPALGGALAALVAVWLGAGLRGEGPPAGAAVTFELHAPGARQVELVGSFNHWKPGDIVLVGPDATGHWTATVEVPAGRHEYLFLVDGREWRTDPNAPAHRPDGFGRENALLEL